MKGGGSKPSETTPITCRPRHSIPASLNYSNYRRYQHAGSVTAYRELPGRNHFVLGQSGWREDALCILTWLHQLTDVTDVGAPKSGAIADLRRS